MKLRCSAALLVMLATGSPIAEADGGPFGLGLVGGKPTGLTAAYRSSDRTALAGTIGLDLFDGRRFYVQGDFLFVLPDLLGGGAVGLSPYLGPGFFLSDLGKRDGSRVGIGARVPFGLSLDFRRAPIQIFGEFAVFLPLVPDVDLGVGGAVGFRYYF